MNSQIYISDYKLLLTQVKIKQGSVSDPTVRQIAFDKEEINAH